MKSHELKAGGKDVDVTAANRREYVDRYVHWVLDESIAKQFEEFKVRASFSDTSVRPHVKMSDEA